MSNHLFTACYFYSARQQATQNCFPTKTQCDWEGCCIWDHRCMFCTQLLCRWAYCHIKQSHAFLLTQRTACVCWTGCISGSLCRWFSWLSMCVNILKSSACMCYICTKYGSSSLHACSQQWWLTETSKTMYFRCFGVKCLHTKHIL